MLVRTLLDSSRRWQWAGVVAALAFGFALLAVAPAYAGIQEIHVVGAARNNSPEAATKEAFEYARKRAVYLVLKKMRIDRPDALAASLTDQQLDRVIRGASIMQTKRVDDVTYADVTVSVMDTVLLQELNLATPDDALPADANIPTRGILVLPVYVVRDRPYVWEKENILRRPLSSETLKISHGSVVVPTGDFDDLRLIDYRNALTIKSDELKPMFDRYGAEEIIIAIVSKPKEDEHGESTILLRRLSLQGVRVEQITLPPMPEGMTEEDRAQEAVGAIASAASQIALSTSKLQQERLAAAVKVPIYFKYGNAREIAMLERDVRSADGVLFLSVPTIALHDMHGVLYLAGDKEAVRKILTKKGIFVNDYQDGWKVSLR